MMQRIGRSVRRHPIRSHAQSRGTVALRAIPIVLGFLGVAGAIVLGALHGRFLPVHFVTAGVSLAAIAGGLFWVNDVRWRETLASIVYTLFFALCVVLAYMISANRQGRLDLTADQTHTLSPQTVSILQRIDPQEMVRMQVFAPGAEHQQLERFLANYSRETPSFRFDIHDAARDLDVVMQLGGNISNGDMILVRQDAEGNVVRRESGELDVGDQRREHTLTNALARLMQTQQERIYFTTGHGERHLDGSEGGMTMAAQLIADTVLPARQVRLMESGVPEDAAAVVVAGPTRDLFDYELEVLQHYLDEGGKLLFLFDPVLARGTAADLDNFETLLRHVGLQSPNELIVDPVSVPAFGRTFTPVVGFTRHEISQGTRRTPFYMDQARPFFPVDNLPDGIRQEVVLVTNDQVWTEPFEELRSITRPVPPDNPERVRMQYVAVASEKLTPGGRWGDRMRVVAVGDSDAFVDELLERNGDAASFLVASMNWLRERQELLAVPPRYLRSTPVVLTTTRAWVLLGTFLAIGLAITVGGTAWTIIRRKTR